MIFSIAKEPNNCCVAVDGDLRRRGKPTEPTFKTTQKKRKTSISAMATTKNISMDTIISLIIYVYNSFKTIFNASSLLPTFG
jgi:hypothetical protein